MIIPAILLISLGVWFFTIRNDTTPVATTPTISNKGETTTPPATTPDTPPPSETIPKDDTPPPPTTNTPVKEPSGTFVSSHHVSLSAPGAIQSTCNTTAGAKCSITFTKNGVTKSLGEKQTDADGVAYWTWTLQEKGISAGSWAITAIASLGTQTKTTNDPLSLEVSP